MKKLVQSPEVPSAAQTPVARKLASHLPVNTPERTPTAAKVLSSTNHRQTRSNGNLRLSANLLKVNLAGGVLTEVDVIKESVRQVSTEQLLSLIPTNLIKAQQERQRTLTFKFEAAQVFMRLWQFYT